VIPSLDVPSTANAILAGGASSPVRAGAGVGGAPFVQTAGRGAYAYDADGRSYIDYVMAYGPLLFGHAHPALVGGLDAVAARGTVFGSTSLEELRLARRIGAHLPSIEALRFTTTGTEAVMSAVRVARAYTGRNTIARFAGNYHGHFDMVLHEAGASARSSADARTGIPPSVRAQSVVARYNDLDDLDDKLADCEGDLAAILVEPVAGNMGVVNPLPGFLSGLRAACDRTGTLLVFDEVITGFRLALGGAQQLCGVRPDLTVLGKVIGGGLPTGAYGGRADLMRMVAPEGPVYRAGTLSGNPLACAAGLATLRELESDPPFGRLEAAGDGLREALAGLPVTVNQAGSLLTVFLTAGPVEDYAGARRSDLAEYAALHSGMLAAGVYLPPSQFECLFLSTAHGEVEMTRLAVGLRTELERIIATR